MGPYFRRKIYDSLCEWKQRSNGETALLIEGARRVGKTTVVTRFAEENYRSHIVINFAAPSIEDVKEMFTVEGSDFDRLFFLLQNMYGVVLHRRESLIVFDEVQMFPPARQMIKQLVEDGRFDYIETGSLISIRNNVKDIVIPSEEERIEMHPMDFEEFLWAMGDEGSMALIRDAFARKQPLGRRTHERLMNSFRIYMMVGGMPQAVNSFITTKDMNAVERVKTEILNLYREDTQKIEERYRTKAKGILEAVPGMLSKHDKSFSPSAVRRNSRTREYLGAITWLSESKMVRICIQTTDPNPALDLNTDELAFKVYMADTGLLFTASFRSNSASRNRIYLDLMNGNMSINEGMFFENVVAQELTSAGRSLIYCKFKHKDSAKSQEVDFILAEGDSVVPVEVKSSPRSRAHKSLDRFMDKFSKNRKVGPVYVVHTKDLSVDGAITYIPVYMVPMIAEIRKSEFPKDAWERLLENSLFRQALDSEEDTLQDDGPAE